MGTSMVLFRSITQTVSGGCIAISVEREEEITHLTPFSEKKVILDKVHQTYYR